MTYFANNYSKLSLPPTGFRNAQLGAIHAVASYFTLHQKPEMADPALVVMPTGSGKTAVLLACAFLLRPEKRVLVVTPSRAVRNQIAAEAGSLATLKRIGAIPEGLDGPRVIEVEGLRKNEAAWQELGPADLVVGTPNSLSPGAHGVVKPPADPMFDLILVDEAHHGPAPTWRALLAAFPGARKLLCTATPFRRDELEIRAHTVYEYPLSQAIDDGIVCRLDYVPVIVGKGENPDQVLARRAAEVLQREKREARNRSYRLLVRTDHKTHTKELAEIYEKIGLNLRTIHSQHSKRWIDQSINKLREGGELDGLICVDMLGEGFDFPPLICSRNGSNRIEQLGGTLRSSK